MSGGVFCASDILDRPLIAEMYLGEQLIDPATIAADPAQFDALEYCRGERLRTKRAAVTASRRQRREADEAVKAEDHAGGVDPRELGRRLEIHQAERFAEGEMLLWLEIHLPCGAMLVMNHIGALVGTDGYFVQRDIGDRGASRLPLL